MGRNRRRAEDEKRCENAGHFRLRVHFVAPEAVVAARSRTTILFADGGGANVKTLSAMAGGKFQFITAVYCGRLSSSVFVITSLHGSADASSAIQICQSTSGCRKA